MLPVTKPQQYVSAASLTSNIDTETANTTRYLPDVSSIDTLRVCRACLAMNVNMYHMSQHKLSLLYERVTGFKINTEDKLPKLLCWECVARLSSANTFIKKSSKAHLILVNKLNSSKLVTISDIESIDRAHHKLESTLGFKVSNESDSNLYIIRESEVQNGDGDNKEVEEMSTDTMSDYNELISEGNPILRGAKEVCEDIKQNQNKIQYRETPLKNRWSGALPQCKELRVVLEDIMLTSSKQITQDSSEQLTAINKEILEKEKKIEISKTTNASRVGTGTVDNTISFTQNITEYSKNVFICDICGKEFNIKSILIQHIRKHPEMYRYSVKSHINYRHKKKFSFYCDYCGYKSFFKHSLISHIDTEHTKKVSLNCSCCNYKTYNKISLAKHVNAKHPKPKVYNCSFCSYKAYRNDDLTIHVNAKHTKTNVYNCSFCSYKTYNKISLAKHFNANHTKVDVFKCSFCSHKAYRKDHLSKHVNAKHTKIDVYYCSFCSFKAYRNDDLKIHVNAQHTKKIVYNCSICSYKAYAKRNLTRHVIAKHTKTKVNNK